MYDEISQLHNYDSYNTAVIIGKREMVRGSKLLTLFWTLQSYIPSSPLYSVVSIHRAHAGTLIRS